VAQTCKDIGVPFVDVIKRFEQEEDPRTLYLFPLDAHTSPKGHRLIADSIFEKMLELKLLTTRVSASASRGRESVAAPKTRYR
jgi:lysophospholipase L1-like esterase